MLQIVQNQKILTKHANSQGKRTNITANTVITAKPLSIFSGQLHENQA